MGLQPSNKRNIQLFTIASGQRLLEFSRSSNFKSVSYNNIDIFVKYIITKLQYTGKRQIVQRPDSHCFVFYIFSIQDIVIITNTKEFVTLWQKFLITCTNVRVLVCITLNALHIIGWYNRRRASSTPLCFFCWWKYSST